MKKIVVNRSFGGFGLSSLGVQRYAEIKGIPLVITTDEQGILEYWKGDAETVKQNRERFKELDKGWYTLPVDTREALMREYDELTLNPILVPRDDPALVQAVEELGEIASEENSTLKVIEIPDDVEWVLQEYDGWETIAEKHRTW